MRTLTYAQKVEQSINKKFRKDLWSPFLTAINEYKLIEPHDKIAVCISGGKDSFLMAKLFQQLHRHTDIPFDVVFLSMDPGYNEANRIQIEKNARLLEIPVTFFETNVFRVADYITDKPCYMCARMRRGHLYNTAKNLGCNKIALGHHLNDVIETTVMSMFYSAKIETMIPKCHSENFEGMELIRPMYGIKEEDILHWVRYNNLTFIQCACKMTEKSSQENNSKRKEIKNLINELKKTNPDLENNLFRSVHQVYVHTFPGYKTSDHEYHTFLENYDKE